MRPSDLTSSGDLAACRALMRSGSKTFATASFLLPARVRDPATAIYAFCRVADDAVDEQPGATDATIDALRGRLDRIYGKRPDANCVDRALAVIVARVGLPRDPFDALLEGLAWDARGRRYETLDELHAYGARVAGSVGALMTVLMGRRDPAVLARACDLGVAMQLTNIARDVGEDARRGRMYLPLLWLREAGVDADAWLTSPAPTPAIAAVVARLLASADLLYQRADAGVARLPRDCRIAIYAARLAYSDIGRSIARMRFDSVTSRAYVPMWRKLLLLVRALGAHGLRAPADAAPPLEPTRFLVRACEKTS